MGFLAVLVVGAVGFALYIDRKRKKINNQPPSITHPHAKPGDESNYMMGDNNHTHGGQ